MGAKEADGCGVIVGSKVVGAAEGGSVGSLEIVGSWVGSSVGCSVGLPVGCAVGDAVGC